MLLLLLLPVARLNGQIDDAQLKADLRAITRPASRSIATDGYYQTANWILDEIRKLPNVELQVHEFPIVVPVTKSATLTLPDGSTENVYPFWPAGARVCSTPEDGIRGRLIYCGEGRIDQIPIAQIAGQIAVVESTARYAWTRAISSGARAIIVLGSDDTNNFDLRSHDIRMPINLPRFYVPEGKLARELRHSLNSREATLRASVSWETRTALNIYALVNSSKPNTSHRAALMLYAPFDSTSLVPDLAPGASQAIQTVSALALLRDFSRAPPDRPTIVAFSGADGIQLLGSRQMLLALAEARQMWWQEMGELSQKQSDAYQARYRANEVRDRPEMLDVRRDRAVVERIVRGIEIEQKLAQDELFRLRVQPGDSRAAQSELESRQATLHRLKAAFQNNPAELSKPENAQPAREIVARTIARMDELLEQHATRKGLLDRRVELYQWLARATGRNPDPAESDSASRLIELVIGIDLSDHGTRIGPLTEGQFQRTTSIGDVQDYLSWLNRAAREHATWFELIRDRIDLEPPSQIRSPRSYLCASMAISTEMAQAWGVPGFSFVTLDDQRLRRDTPTDTLEHINIDAIVPQLRAVREIVTRAANDPAFQGPTDRQRLRASIPGQVVSLAPGKPVPNLGRGGFLVAYHYVSSVVSVHPKLRALPWVLGVRRNELTTCDAEGNYLVEGLPRLHNDGQLFAMTAHRVDERSGAITASTDLGKQAGDIKIYFDIKHPITPMKSLVFDCEEVALVDVIDPRFMQPLNEATLLDARREAEPQRFCFFLHDRFFAGFLEPGTRTAYAFRYGRVGNRLLMLNPLNGEPASAGVSGFAPSELLAHPLALTTAQNFWTLNDGRLNSYRRAGVSSSVIDSMHHDSADELARAKTALGQNDSADFAKSSELAWSNEARVYDAVRDLADDVVRGAIFLLLLCVPFAFCMERLLIGTPNVYRQIIGSATIFAIMTAALWSFHPAFKISASPLIIVLAFAIIFMSLVVIVVLYNKFDVELKRIRSGRAVGDEISLRRVGVLANAVLLGISNMRRRPLRTTLTSITIVLITFAVLCFTSSTSYLDTLALATGEPTNGKHEVMLRQRGYRAIPPDIADSLSVAIGRDKATVERWWNVSSADPKDQIALVAQNRVVAMQGLLGLAPGEADISSAADVMGREKFARLQSGERDIIYLSSATATQLNVKEGDRIRVAGTEVQVAGIYDAAQVDRTVHSLSGESIGPLLYERDSLDTGGRKLDDTAPESFELGGASGGAGAAELHANYEQLSSSAFAIVPAALSQYLPNPSLRTVTVQLQNESQVKQLSDALAKRFALACFAGYDDGVRMVSAGNLTRVSGAGQIAIPLVIAGLIVFNTMMGSIAERRREIHVYTSLGLAPLHVGALFLAEASVYGLLGTVFGYIIGQAAGTVLTKLGWLGDVTMNYSGTSAILTMSAMLTIVLVSALIPARIASKIASPSIERTWQVPPPVDDSITATLPFTINRTAADGAIAYLTEFFESHSDASIGKFAAGAVRPIRSEDSAARGLATEIWLMPFDLGIRQQLTLLIREGKFKDIFEVEVHLTRASGDERTWHRANRPFLAELRKQFLQWRTLSRERMQSYATQSQRLAEQVQA